MKPPKTHSRPVLCSVLYGISIAYFVVAALLLAYAPKLPFTAEESWSHIFLWAVSIATFGVFLFTVAAVVDVMLRIAQRTDEMAQMIYELRAGPISPEMEAQQAEAAAAAMAAAQSHENGASIPAHAKFFYMVKEEIFGPFEFEELLDIKSHGEISDNTLVQKEDEDKWVELGSLVPAQA